MVSQAEIRELITQSRSRGAIIRTYADPPYDESGNGIISRVMVRRGIPGVGGGWMPVSQAAERLRQFIGGEA